MMEFVTLKNSDAEARIYLYGAHLTHFQRKGEAPLLFLSEKSAFEPGKPIRGGAPIIFPWFGKHADPKMPVHGFARTQMWTIESSGDDRVTLLLQANQETRAIWPCDFELRYTVTIGKTLTMSLEVRNTDYQAITFDDGLHTYFTVGDVRQIRITGLHGAIYRDRTKSMEKMRDDAEVLAITESIDRVYFNHGATCVIDDPSLKRRITIEKKNSNTTVVWNPSAELMKNFADLSPNDWRKFMCVESCNAQDNAITLNPGESHVLTTIVSS